MIGYEAGGGGGIGWSPPSSGDIDRIRNAWDTTVDTIRDRATDVLEVVPVFDLIAQVEAVATWVLETVAIVYPVPIEGWRTASDERVCPECGPLDEMTWEDGAGGPQPPLHGNCRCWRGVVRTEWRVRFVDEWRLRWTVRTVWDWVHTGWA
ncbi:MAG: hypothetical protein QM753_13040 [Thermomicrobiales bacterium]